MGVLHESFGAALVVAVIGQIIRRVFMRTKETQKYADLGSWFLVYLTIPATLFRTMSGVHSVPREAYYLAALSVGYELVCTPIFFLLMRRVDRRYRGVAVGCSLTFAICTFFLPLMDSLAGQYGVVLLAFFDFTNEFFLYIGEPLIFYYMSRENPKKAKDVAVEESAVELKEKNDDGSVADVEEEAPLTFNPKKFLLRLAINFPLWSVVIGLICGLCEAKIPFFLQKIIDILANANSFLSFLLIGLYLDVKKECLLKYWKASLISVALRYVFGIAAGIAFYFGIGKYFTELGRLVLLTGFCMPLPSAVTAVAVENKVDPALPALITNETFIVGFAVLWVMVAIVGLPETA